MIRTEVDWTTPPATSIKSRRWGMSEISEKTKIGLTVGGAIIAFIFVLGVGRYWGTWETERGYTLRTLERHDVEIAELRKTFSEMQGSLRDIKNNQDNSKESMATAVRNTTYLVSEIGNLKVALAERGIKVKEE